MNKILRPGTLLQDGKYRIGRCISVGSFECVYEAEHTMFNERVDVREFFASKYCHRNIETGIVSIGVSSKTQMIETMRQKFIDDAVVQHRMANSNIIRVLDLFEENHTSYSVMEFVDGLSLDDLLNDRKVSLSEQEALCYIRQVADALAYMHANGRFHLSISPDNIMIDRNGRAVIDIEDQGDHRWDEYYCDPEAPVAYNKYAPIEQMGGDFDMFSPATDIFSLGSTLYKLLTGSFPTCAIDRACGSQLKPLPTTISESTCLAVEQSMKLKGSERPQSIAEFLGLLLPPPPRLQPKREFRFGGLGWGCERS